jgi:hypothetical protein
MMKNTLVLVFLLVVMGLQAQKTDWYVNFHSIADNREYDRSVGKPQTIFGTRLDIAGGLKIDSVSGVYLGVNYMYEFGSSIDAITPVLNLYYVLDRSDFGFYFGSFPKEKVIDFPLALYGELTNYFEPNIGGMAFEVRRKWGKQNVYVDWIGRQTDVDREAFIAGFSGVYKSGMFYAKNYGYMYHLALTSVSDPDMHIRDNGVFSGYVGFDFSEKTSFDVLNADIGGIFNYDRTRPDDYSFYGGFVTQLNARYRRFGIDVTSYWGKGLQVPLGDALYSNGNYTRMDFCAVPIKWKGVESVFKWSYHFTGGVVSSSQQFFLTARF